MSRKRDDKKKKQKELARQMGVKTSEVAEHHYLQEQERVTRPELRIQERIKPKGIRGLLGGGPEALGAAVYVIEASRKRCVGVVDLTDKKVQLPKISYSRPAHFVVVVFDTRTEMRARIEAAGDALRLGGAALDDESVAPQAWETPRVVEVEGQPAAAAIVRGVDRTTAILRFPVGRGAVLVEVKV